MSQILDEIIENPTSPSNLLPQSNFGDSRSIELHKSASNFPRRRESDIQMGSLNLSSSDAMQPDDEMDWTPTHSQHRAFNTYGQRQSQGFNEAPVEPKGPFWYRVPAAPTTPAQRLYNPPNQPRLQTSPIAKENPFAKTGRAGSSSGSRLRNRGEEEEPPLVKFAPPKFFAQPQQNDPRNSLSDLFGQSFSLSQEEQAEQEKSKGWLGGFGFGTGSGSGSRKKKN